MAGKGRRYDETKLNMKKVFAVILALVVLIMSVVVVKGILEKGSKKGRFIGKSYFAVYQNDKWGVIDEAGNIVIDPSYAEMIIIPDSKKDVFLCMYDVNYEDGTYKTKAINSKNEETYTYYDQIEAIQIVDEGNNMEYMEGILKVQKEGKYGVIDFEGKEVVECIYDKIEASPKMTGAIKVEKDGKYGLIKKTGEKILDTQYENITGVNETGKYVIVQEGKQKLVKDDGTELLSGNYDEITEILELEENGVIYKKSGKYGVMKLTGEVTIEPQYENLKEAKSGKLIAKKDGKYGVINLNNETELEFKYSNISSVSKADIYITENEQFENEILNGNYEVRLSGILVDLDTEKGYLEIRNNEGIKFYNFQFEEKEESEIFTNITLFLSKKDGKYGFVDKSGKVVVDYKYDDATNQNAYGFAGIKKDGKWGSIDQNGKIVQEPTYNLDDYLQINFIGRWHLGKDINMNYFNQI
ncbi:MAG: WG repeat-containing protein [Clostridia bacterium]|nr:WG repeat-containing protein [Clostridia bacterium]